MLTVAEVVHETGMSEYAVRGAIRAGELGHKWRGRNLYVPRHALEAYVNDITRGASS